MEIDPRLVITGVLCDIARDDATALRMDRGMQLTLWQNKSEFDLFVDRYDVRLLLSSFDSDNASCNSDIMLVAGDVSEEEELLYERYRDLLDCQESSLLPIINQEPIEVLVKPDTSSFAFPSNFTFPPHLSLPSQRKQFSMIMHTAKTTRGKPQLEVLLRLKQQNNPNFDFLLTGHYLFDFYEVY